MYLLYNNINITTLYMYIYIYWFKSNNNFIIYCYYNLFLLQTFIYTVSGFIARPYLQKIFGDQTSQDTPGIFEQMQDLDRSFQKDN